LLAPTLALFCLNPVTPAQEVEETAFQKALARYKVVMQRLPFRHHTEGRAGLAQTHCLEALLLLIRDYGKPHSYPEYTRYTIAHLIGTNFDKAEFLPQLDAMMTAHRDPVDMWMWVHALRIHTDRMGDAQAMAIATEDKDVLHRAAAILALGQSRSGRLRQAIRPNCLEFPKKEADRAVLLGAMSGALWHAKSQVNDADYRLALEAYINLLGPDVGLTEVAKIQMARHLQWILNGPALFTNREPWLALLNRGEVKEPPKGETRATPSFFGIETEGERFCYVLDMSDSMCKEIAKGEQSEGPTTGPKPKRKKGIVPSESDLPWHLIKTRWDLAREQLRISLFRLSDDKYFSVIWFGTESGTFEACPGMIRATKRNVDRVLAEIDAVTPGPKDAVKAPDGVLRGDTNLHAGLRRAFALTNRGFVEEPTFVEPGALTEGCDTIFLLSDGAPSWDDFHIVDKDYGEGRVVADVEYGAEAPRTPTLVYHGPYSSDANWLAEDVRRLNAFRRIRMHCVGLGEANMSLLRRLAEMGHGEAFEFGSKAKAAGGK
jgi:hypothetical protein